LDHADEVSPQVKHAVDLAKQYLGTPYVWGGAKPGGFDCSGLLKFVWGKLGVNIPRVSQDQWKYGRPVGVNQLEPGDAVFFHMKSGGPGHTGMFIGHDQFLHAPHSGDVVKISKLSTYRGYVGARRFT
jgi:cell wall-associated NlpC family hydrolase